MADLVAYLAQGLRLALQDLGVRSVKALHEGAAGGTVRFELRSPSAQREGGVHDLYAYTQPDAYSNRQ